MSVRDRVKDRHLKPIDSLAARVTRIPKKPKKGTSRKLHGTSKESQNRQIEKIEVRNRRKKAEREL
jgi:CBS domain containing-hemolysin-like protein